MKIVHRSQAWLCGAIGRNFYLLTYLLTPWCRVLLEKLTGLQLVKKLPTFYGTRMFITVLTSLRHLSITYLTYLLTPWCRVLLEKLIGFQLVKKLPAFYGTRRFITTLRSLRHLSLTYLLHGAESFLISRSVFS